MLYRSVNNVIEDKFNFLSRRQLGASQYVIVFYGGILYKRLFKYQYFSQHQNNNAEYFVVKANFKLILF